MVYQNDKFVSKIERYLNDGNRFEGSKGNWGAGLLE